MNTSTPQPTHREFKPVRQCRSCGCYLRSGNESTQCSPCGTPAWELIEEDFWPTVLSTPNEAHGEVQEAVAEFIAVAW